MSRFRILLFVCLFASSAAYSQAAEISIGKIRSTAAAIFGNSTGTPTTVIDLSSPASADGSISHFVSRVATVNGSCTGATFKVRVFRQNGQAKFDLVAERGPFPMNAGLNSVDLTPAIAVSKNDVIGVLQSGGDKCGVELTYDDTAYGMQALLSDFAGGTISDQPLFREAPQMRASTSSLVFSGVLPAVGSTAGAGGSAFRTSFVLLNPWGTNSATVKLVFHPLGQAPTANDPSTTLTLDARHSKAPDVMRLLGATGVGSVDVFTDGATPVISARVYNETGNGTNGFTETIATAADTLGTAEAGFLNIPADLDKFRMNIGVRAMNDGASLICTAYDASFNKTAQLVKDYAPNVSELQSAANFFGVATPLSNAGMVRCYVNSGSAIVYGTVTDNTTNDSAYALAVRR